MEAQGAKAVSTRSVRSDVWTDEADAKLVEIVLESVRSGATQCDGFQRAAGILGRTPAAVGFRWNGLLRKKYGAEIAEAKKIGKEVRSQTNYHGQKPTLSQSEVVTSSSAMQQAIDFLRGFDSQYRQMEVQLATLQNERDDLVTQVQLLEDRINATPRVMGPTVDADQLHNDAQMLLGILQRAKQKPQQRDRAK